jgi:tetratricopeptide (TPR) repeat protein
LKRLWLLVLVSSFSILVSGCRKGEVIVDVTELSPEERKIFADVKPYVTRIERRPQDVAAYLEASRILRKAGYTSYARRFIERGLSYSPQSLELLLEKARIEEDSGLYSQALEDYLAVLKAAPEDVTALRGAARSAFRSGKRDDAGSYLAQARQLSPSDPGLMLDEAEFAYLDGDIEKALSLSRDASNLAPHLPGPYYNQGLALLRMGKLDEAQAAAEKALTLSPNAAEIHSLMGEIKYAQADDAAAEASARKALEISPHFDQPYRTLAKIAAKKGDADKALENFKTAVTLNPSDYYSLTKLRQMAQERKDDELALFTLRRLSRLDVKDFSLRSELASVALKQEQFSEAAAEFRIIAEQTPTDADSWKGLGETYVAVGDNEGVVEAYSRLDALGKAGPAERLALAMAYLESGMDAKAAPYIAALSQELPAKDPRLARLIGQKLYREGRVSEAADYLMVAAKAGDEEAAFKASVVKAALGQYSEAAAILEDLHKKDPSRADIARLLAELRERGGDVDGAFKTYSSVLALNPDDPYAGEFMARYYYENNDAAGAKSAVDKVLEVAPNSVKALEIKANLLEAAGDYVGALAVCAKVRDLEPGRKDIAETIARIQQKVPETLSVGDLWAAYKKSPKDFGLLWRIAETEAENDPAKAINTLRLLVRNPDTRRAALERTSDLYLRLDDWNKASSTAKQITTYFPEDSSGFVYYADVLAQHGAYNDALPIVKKAVDMSPNYVPALKLAGRIQLARNDPQAALAMYEMLKRIDPADPETIYSLCSIYTYHIKDQARARAAFAELVKLGVNTGTLEQAINEMEPPLPLVPNPQNLVEQPNPQEQPQPPANLTEEKALKLGPDLPAVKSPK